MAREKFFPDPCEVPDFKHRPTLVRILETDSKGKEVFVVKDLCEIEDPLYFMKYDDFTITNLLKNGVDIKPITKSKNTKLGVDDAEIDAFNARLDEINSQLINLNS